MMRLRLDYYDHNEKFARLLPQDGKIESLVSSSDGNSWALFHTDASVEYENLAYDYLLLRSRWKGQKIGGNEPTSVFVLLVDDLRRVLDGFEVNDFEHVAWGMAARL